jgi:D-tyrosyl-tRNA(Tyr) deacylase
MGAGLLALVGVQRGDGPADAQELANKLVNLRVLADAQARMNRSLLETGGTLALVSQFTLLGDTRKGRRPSYGQAADPTEARALFEDLVRCAMATGVAVVTGRFGASMEVALVNDGPVTLLVDTRGGG